MRFLLRITFWLGLVLVLLPRDKTPESDKLPQIGAADAVQAATAAVSDMTQFCKRQPAACEVGGQAATIIGQRAQDGAKKIYQIINDKKEQLEKHRQEGARPHRLDRAGRRRRCRRERGAARHPVPGRPRAGMARPGARDGELAPKPYRFRRLASLYWPERELWASMTTIDEIRDNFELLDEWDDRYRYVIELGRTLEPMSEAEHSAENKVNGCVSQVWLQKLVDHRDGGAPILKYRGDSDAHIVRGLVAIVLSLYSGRTPQEILATDAIAVFDEFGFRDHLTPQRSNGLRSMVERIKTDAKEALAEAS